MTTEIVLFDLGGVLVELGGVQEFAGMANEADEETIWRRWLGCPWVRRFERGLCSADEFAAGMVESWSLRIAPGVFLDAFADWPKGLLPGATELVHETASRTRVACLSNTNAVHAERHWDGLEIERLFDARFFSHEMGCLKPDREAFTHAIEALDCAPDRILFLDDNQINVDGARAAGLDAERAVGVESARSVLAARGLV